MIPQWCMPWNSSEHSEGKVVGSSENLLVLAHLGGSSPGTLVWIYNTSPHSKVCLNTERKPTKLSSKMKWEASLYTPVMEVEGWDEESIPALGFSS